MATQRWRCDELVQRRTLWVNCAGLLTAWLLALLPVHIGYSQAARGYALLVLFAALATFALWRALSGSRWNWAAYAVCCFAGAYVIPSGALHWAALLIWSAALALLKRDWRLLRWVGLVNLAVGLGVSVAYWPLREQLVLAGSKWGTAIDDPLALSRLAAQVFLLSSGSGFEGVVPGLLAGAGTALLLWKRRDLGTLALAVWIVPLFIGILMGTAGQPRSYLFVLLPFLLTIEYGALHAALSALARSVAVILVLGGFVWVSRDCQRRQEKESGPSGLT